MKTMKTDKKTQVWITIDDIEDIESPQSLKNEAEATTWLLWYFREKIKDAWIYKIPDVGIALKPYDVCCVVWDKFYPIEIKFIKNKKINRDIVKKQIMKNLEMHQAINLEYLRNIGNTSIVVGYAKNNKTFYFFKY